MSATQAEPIAFETAGQVEELLERLQESLQNTLHAHRASSSKSAEYNDEVERRVQERFEYMRQALLSNVTVAGQPYHEEKPTDMQPFDEALNRNFVTYETKVNESICTNTMKRRDAPRKAAQYAESAFNHYATARETTAERLSKTLDVLRQEKTLVYDRIPDQETASAQYIEALAGIKRLAQEIPLQHRRAHEALQVQRDIETLRAQSMAY